MIRVLIVDDHDLVRDAVGAALVASGRIDVVAACENGRQAVTRYAQLRPDVVLMDLSMPVLDGVAATREIRAADPSARVVILTSGRVSRTVDDAFAAGAMACVFKDDDPAHLIRAVVSAAGAGGSDAPELAPAGPVIPAPPDRNRGWRPGRRRPRA